MEAETFFKFLVLTCNHLLINLNPENILNRVLAVIVLKVKNKKRVGKRKHIVLKALLKEFFDVWTAKSKKKFRDKK